MHFLIIEANGLLVIQAWVIVVAAFVIAIVPLIEHSLFDRKVFKVLDEWPSFLLTSALLIILPYYLLYNERVNSYLTSLSPRFTDPSKVAYSYTALFTLTIILAAIILTVRFGFNVWLNMDKSRIFELVMIEISHCRALAGCDFADRLVVYSNSRRNVSRAKQSARSAERLQLYPRPSNDRAHPVQPHIFVWDGDY